MAKKIIQLFIFLGLGIFFIWFSVKDLKQEDVEIIKNSAMRVLHFKSLLFILLSMMSGIIANYFRAIRNIQMINPLGYRVRKTTAFYSVMILYLANLAIPRLGEALRCTFMQRYDKVPFQKSFGIVVIERVLDLLIFVLLFILIFFLNKSLLSESETIKELGVWMGEKWTWILQMKRFFICILLLSVIALIFFTRHKKKKKLQETIKKQSKIILKIKKIMVGFWQGFVSIINLKHPYLFIIYTIAIWLFYFLGTFFCFFAFDFLQPLGPMPAFVILVVGSIGFMAAQGGLGAYPLIVASILALYGVDYAQGLAAGWIGWCAQTIMILVVGFTTLILASFLKIENRIEVIG
jgi:uncharacterized protein (TIRG00374 family)